MNAGIILFPFFGTMLLTMVVWLYMYTKRLPFVLRSQLTPEQLTPQELARLSPPDVANPSDNLKNLFELPTLFYAVVLYLLTSQLVDAWYTGAAWVFFVFRVLHSIVHCTVNVVRPRFLLYAISSAALWFMILRLSVNIFFQSA